MKIGWVICPMLWLGRPALAADPPEVAPEEGVSETVTGRKAAPLKASTTVTFPPVPQIKALQGMSYEQLGKLPHPTSAYSGAQALKMDVALIAGIQQGVELVYRRQYNQAIAHFHGLEKTWPNTALGPVSEALVWQARMLENFDFRYDVEYAAAAKRAKAGLEAAVKIPGNEAWEHFLLAAVVGVDSIHTMRKGSYLSALQDAFSAMDHIQKANALAPDFADLKIADGMYNYWRSVVTLSSNLLPDFSDRRSEGVAQMQLVEARGVFLGPAATLALAFTWLEEGNLKNALSCLQTNRRSYPDNVVNNLLVGSTYLYMKKVPNALAMFDEVLADDPSNRRAHYWKGVAYQTSLEWEKAGTEYKTYLNSEYMEKYQKSAAFFRLGQTYHHLKRFDEAEVSWKSAAGIDGNERAKAALNRLEQARKAGKVPD